MQNIPVLAVSTSSGLGGSNAAQVTLKTTSYQAEELAFASDNGKIWLTLRPPTGARAAAPSLVTVETLLLGVSPVAELRTFGGKS
jgi:Flp pilus assembly protein CpaB